MDVKFGGKYRIQAFLNSAVMNSVSAYLNKVDCLMLMLLFIIAALPYSYRITDEMFDCRINYVFIMLSLFGGVLIVKQWRQHSVNINFKTGVTVITLTCVVLSVYSLYLWGYIGRFKCDFVSAGIMNPVGIISCICLGLPYILCLSREYKSNKTFPVIIICLCLLALMLSQSRTGIITAVLIIAEFFMHRKNVPLRKRLAIFIILSLVLVCAAFFINSGSAVGRLVVWQSSWLMFCDAPVWGHGLYGFEKEYMNFQAEFLSMTQKPLFNFLADNVNYPYNEIIRLVLCFGVTGLIFVSVLVYAIVKNYLKNPSEKKYIAILSLIALFMLGVFSYPLSFPLTWLIIIVDLFVIFNNNRVKSRIRPLIHVIGVGIVVWNFTYNLTCIGKNSEWKGAYAKSDLELYQDLYSWYDSDPSFLYNYAYVLYQNNDFAESLDVALKCSDYLASFDLSMLIGEGYYRLSEFEKAIAAFDEAARMCPNRFLPLYRIFSVHNEMNNKSDADIIAQKIIDMPVKVPSALVQTIKVKVFNYLNSIN